MLNYIYIYIYIYPKLLEEVDMTKKKKVRKIKKDIELLIWRSWYEKRKKKKEKKKKDSIALN